MKMIKMLLVVIGMLFTCTYAFSEWLEISGHPTAKGGKFYVDKSQIQKYVNGAKLVHLMDLPYAQLNAYGKPYLSEKMLMEYDCGSRRTRILSISQYASSMGKGDAVYDFEGKGRWIYFSLDPVARTMEEMMCGKKQGASLFTAHPGWLDLIQSKKFLNWLQSQNSEVQALASTTNEAESILLIDKFKSENP